MYLNKMPIKVSFNLIDEGIIGQEFAEPIRGILSLHLAVLFLLLV